MICIQKWYSFPWCVHQYYNSIIFFPHFFPFFFSPGIGKQWLWIHSPLSDGWRKDPSLLFLVTDLFLTQNITILQHMTLKLLCFEEKNTIPWRNLSLLFLVHLNSPFFFWLENEKSAYETWSIFFPELSANLLACLGQNKYFFGKLWRD